MRYSTIDVYEETSGRPEFSSLVVSVRQIFSDHCIAVIGYPGLPNVVQDMKNGDAVLYQTTEDGTLEIRVMAIRPNQTEFLVTQVSPRPGFGAALLEEDPNNSLFNETELARIAESVLALKDELLRSSDFAPEQLGLINRKLDEIQAASQRLGRKDWINYVAGTVTAVCISAAFSPDMTRSLFRLLNSAFTWLFANAPILLEW